MQNPYSPLQIRIFIWFSFFNQIVETRLVDSWSSWFADQKISQWSQTASDLLPLGLCVLLVEGAWERPGLPALLACFSWGPWSRGKDPEATSPSVPAQSEYVTFLARTLRAGCLGLWE